MKKVSFAVFTVVFMLALAPACFGQWTEQLLVSGSTAWRGSPRLWQDKLFYGDMGPTGTISSVYRWTQAQGSVRILGGDGISRAPVGVWENSIVISRIVSGQHKLYLYDGTSETPVATSAGTKENADIYGSTVVWEDHRGAYSQVYIWDETLGERVLAPSSSNQSVPKIWNDTVTWQQGNQVYVWTPTAGAQSLGYGWSPAVYEDKVVFWVEQYYDPVLEKTFPGHLWQWTAATGKVSLAEHNWTTGFQNTDMWGTLVVAEYGRAWDPVYGFTYNAVNMPSVYGNQVAGIRGYNVYLETLVPEPGGLLTLGGMLFLCGVSEFRRRRRTR